MTIAVAAISAVGYVIALLKFQNNDFNKQFVLLVIYLI